MDERVLFAMEQRDDLFRSVVLARIPYDGLVRCISQVMQNLAIQLLNQILTFLGLIGVIVDPTTAGMGDSERALGYDVPWDDNR